MKIYNSPSISYFWQQMAARNLMQAMNARQEAVKDPANARFIRIRMRYHAKGWREYVGLARKTEERKAS